MVRGDGAKAETCWSRYIKQNCLFCRMARKCPSHRLRRPNTDARFFLIERSKGR